jgi:hypothetical protein
VTETKPSPRPWKQDGDEVIDATGNYIVDCRYEGDAVANENATLIVRAVNAHEAMVEALAWAMYQINEPRLVRGQNDEHVAAWQKARAALRLARGES